MSASSNSLAEIRNEARAWFAANFQQRDPEADDDRADVLVRTPDGHHAFVEQSRSFLLRLAEAGLAGCAVPLEFGGRGLTRAHDHAVNDVMMEFATPSLRGIGIGPHLALPTILMAGTQEQKERYVPKIFTGEELWCQMFSEPDAGSDLVSLRCAARLHGDAFVVSGQKVWSSYAADAHFGLLLARTDPDAAKPHAGITMFILPMDLPGVTVRPLVDIGGGLHFNEVFLDEVVLDREFVLGGVNAGWQVANGTLGGERGGYMGGSGGGRRHRQVLQAAGARGGVRQDPVMRQRIVSVIAEERLLEMLRDRLAAGQLCGGNAAAGSMMKVAAGNLEQKVAELLVDLVGLSALCWDPGDRHGDRYSYALNASRQATIAGGTHQIQRNLLGERVLGLPR
jgi:alkylation response protein AidB-like acyl-CoA dehydrogenase